MRRTKTVGHRLSCDHGRWHLDTSELVRLDNNLYRPEHRRIDGPDAILSHLRSRGERNLLSGAEHLLRTSEPSGGAYEAIDGEWIESEPSIAPGRPSRSEQLGNEVAELRAEVVLLRAVCSGLLARVSRLERGTSGVDRTPPSPERSSKNRSKSEPRGVDAGATAQRAETRSTPAPQPTQREASATAQRAESGSTPAPQPAQREASATAQRAESPALAESAAFAESAAAGTGEAPIAEVPDFPFVALPGTQAVSSCVQQLVGSAIRLEVVREKLPTSAEELSLLDVSVMIDDEGRDRVVALSDHRATVECGGLLLGLPNATIQELIRSGESTEDLTLAMSEIFNNLSGIINREADNPHLRAEALTKTPVERLPWLRSPRSQTAFRMPSGGVMWLVSR
jgi:hypothetical protein